MTARQNQKIRWAVVGIIFASACAPPADHTTGIKETAERAPFTPMQLAGQPRTLDERFRAIAVSSPGFAGAYVDSNGDVVVAVSPQSDGSSAVGNFRREFGASALQNRQIRIQSVTWSFTELTDLRDEIESANDGALVFTDIDERANAVRVGVRDASERQRVAAVLAAKRPAHPAVSIIVVSAPKEMTDLTEFVRPVLGGMQVDLQQAAKTCTIGFAVGYYGQSGDYLATNSHCSLSRFATDAAVFRQPTWWAADYPTLGVVGGEVVDPPLFWSEPLCPRNKYCRYSDANLFATSSASAAGKLAITTYSSNVPGTMGSTTLAASPMQVTGALTNFDLFFGLQLNKLGRSSGWTKATLSASCVRWYVYYPQVPTTMSYECQYEANLTVMYGDSGGPMFTINGDGLGAMIAGQVWGAYNPIYIDPNNENNNIFGTVIFSSFSGLQVDLGNIYPKIL